MDELNMEDDFQDNAFEEDSFDTDILNKRIQKSLENIDSFDSDQEDEIEFHKLQLEGQRILLTAVQLIEKINSEETVILEHPLLGLVIFIKPELYRMTSINKIGVTSNVTHENVQFLQLTIRQLLLFGFNEIPESALPVPLDEILGEE